jgi:hypothetical protein
MILRRFDKARSAPTASFAQERLFTPQLTTKSTLCLSGIYKQELMSQPIVPCLVKENSTRTISKDFSSNVNEITCFPSSILAQLEQMGNLNLKLAALNEFIELPNETLMFLPLVGYLKILSLVSSPRDELARAALESILKLANLEHGIIQTNLKYTLSILFKKYTVVDFDYQLVDKVVHVLIDTVALDDIMSELCRVAVDHRLAEEKVVTFLQVTMKKDGAKKLYSTLVPTMTILSQTGYSKNTRFIAREALSQIAAEKSSKKMAASTKDLTENLVNFATTKTLPQSRPQTSVLSPLSKLQANLSNQ